MKKLFFLWILSIVLSLTSKSQELPWQAGLTRIIGAHLNDGSQVYDIGKDYTNGVILIDFKTSMVYVVGNGSYFFILSIEERLIEMEKDKLIKTGISSTIYRCDRNGTSWTMDIQYGEAADMILVHFYFRDNSGVLTGILLDAKFIPQEKLE